MHYFNSIKLRSTPSRKGYGTAELIISMILLGMLIASIVPIFHKVATTQMKYQKQMQLQQTASNLVEQIHAIEVLRRESPEEIQKVVNQFGQSNHVEVTAQLLPAKSENDPLRLQLEVQPDSKDFGLKPVKVTTWLTQTENQKGDS